MRLRTAVASQECPISDASSFWVKDSAYRALAFVKDQCGVQQHSTCRTRVHLLRTSTVHRNSYPDFDILYVRLEAARLVILSKSTSICVLRALTFVKNM